MRQGPKIEMAQPDTSAGTALTKKMPRTATSISNRPAATDAAVPARCKRIFIPQEV